LFKLLLLLLFHTAIPSIRVKSHVFKIPLPCVRTRIFGSDKEMLRLYLVKYLIRQTDHYIFLPASEILNGTLLYFI